VSVGDRRPLHVVAHNGSSILGGGETGTALLLAGLQRRGHRVRMLCRDRAIASRVAEYGIPTGVQRIGGDMALHDAVRLGLALRRLRPDALILTSFKKVFLAGLGARLGSVPFVAQRVVLSTDTGARGARYRYALRSFVDVVTLNAEAMRPAFLAGTPRLDARRVLTVYDGVERPSRSREPGALRSELGIPPGARVVGSVTRLAPQKRLDRLLHALAALPPDVHCVLAGEGPLEAELLALARGLGVDRRTHFLGFRRDVGDVLDALDVFVVCSDREGMANAMLEAMAAGVAVVSTPVSGAAEAFGDAREPAGLVIDEAATGLAPALERLLGDPALRDRIGMAARARIDTEFGAEAFVDRWERLLREGSARRRA
jgi:glycosyltransferase involved in cell wall biosynthesis